MRTVTLRSLRGKAIVWFVIPTAVILATVALLAFRASQKVTEALVLSRNQDRTQLLANQLGQEMRGYLQTLDALASAPNLHHLLPATLQTGWEDADWRSFDSGVLVLDLSGTVMATVPDRLPLASQNWPELAYSGLTNPGLRNDANTVVTDILVDAMPGINVVALARPLWSAEAGVQEGMVVGLFRIERSATRTSSFYQSVWNLYIGRREIAYLVDGRDVVVRLFWGPESSFSDLEIELVLVENEWKIDDIKRVDR